MKKNLSALICLVVGVLLLALHFMPSGKGNLNLTIKHADYIMPAAYKVYANPQALNGEYYLFKMLMKNNGKAALDNVKVSYRIPNYIDWTDLATVPKIYPGQNVVVRCYPQFKDDIVNKMTQSQEKVDIKITYNGSQTKNEEYAFKMMGRNQFVYTDLPPDEIANYSDEFRNLPLLGCLVTPEDPIIKYYTQEVQDKVMKGEEASVSNKPKDAVKFLLGLYDATYLSHMVYSGTQGIPEKLGDINSMVQSIRLPREVVTGNTGLCIELSVLYASVLESAGLHPIIFVIPGHAYPGVLVDGQYYAIEATGIGGEGLGGRLSPAAAFKAGMKELNTFVQHIQEGDSRYKFIDVDALEAKGVVPMELKDNEFLRKKIDEIAENFTQPPANQTPNNGNQYYANGNNTGGGNIATYSGVVSFKYPAAWVRYDHPLRQKPYLLTEIDSRDGSSAIDVVNLWSAGSCAQAVEYMRQSVAQSGGYMTYRLENNKNGYCVYSGVTTASNGVNWQWEGILRNAQNGMAGVIVGGTNFSQNQKLFNSILSTVR